MNNFELPNIVSLLAKRCDGSGFALFLSAWENVIFSLIVIVGITAVVVFAGKKISLAPVSRLQNSVELCVSALDDFVCGILGPKGRQFTPFIGTLFIYILAMNLLGFIPLMKSPTASWSTTFALAICVFAYVQYTAFKELGVKGYMDHLMGRPRGAIAFSVVIPVFMFLIHLITELLRPITLSLRLRSNIWGDDLLLALFAHFGLKGLPFLIFNTFLALLAAVIQSLVFCLLTTIYFALVLSHEE